MAHLDPETVLSTGIISRSRLRKLSRNVEDDNVPAIHYSYNADWVLALLQSQGILGRWNTY